MWKLATKSYSKFVVLGLIISISSIITALVRGNAITTLGASQSAASAE